jgi:hypothetical protein
MEFEELGLPLEAPRNGKKFRKLAAFKNLHDLLMKDGGSMRAPPPPPS